MCRRKSLRGKRFPRREDLVRNSGRARHGGLGALALHCGDPALERGDRPMIRIHCLRSVGALALLGCALTGSAHAESAPSAPPPPFEVDALRADFDALYEGLRSAHYDPYSRRDKAGYDRLFQRMRAQIGAPMSLLEAEVF